MKYAFSLMIIAVAFALGWFINSPTPTPVKEIAKEPEPIELVDASPEWRTKTHGKSTEQVAEAIYQQEMAASFEEKYQLLAGILKKDNTASELNGRRIVMSMSEDELVRAIGQARAEEASRSTMDLLYARWVEINRDAAYAYLIQEPDPDKVSILSYYIFRDWVIEDEAGALAAWSQLDPKTQSARLSTMVNALAEIDLSHALTIQLTYGKADNHAPGTYYNIIQRWTRQDPESAKEAIALIPMGDTHDRALAAYFDVLMETDRDLALSEAKALPSHGDQEANLKRIYDRWINDDIDAALESLSQEKNPLLYINNWQLTQKDPEKAMDWAYNNLDGTEQDYFIGDAISAMVRKDPQLAIGYIDNMPYGDAYSRALSNLAYNWGRQDAQSAFAWFEAMPDGDEKNSGINNILSQYANKDPEAAKAYFLNLKGPLQESASSTIVRNLVQSDPQKALDWINSIDKPELNKKLTEEAYESWAREDASTLFQYLGVNNFSKMDTQQQSNLMRSWADSSPREAAAWIENVSEDQKKTLTDQVSREWLQHNSYEASVWISDLPEGESRQVAVKNLINTIHRSDPGPALDWVMDLPDEKDRYNSANMILSNWKNKAEARDALLASNLPDAEVEKLMAKHFKE